MPKIGEYRVVKHESEAGPVYAVERFREHAFRLFGPPRWEPVERELKYDTYSVVVCLRDEAEAKRFIEALQENADT